MPTSILIAVASRPELRDELADQLAADGDDVHTSQHAITQLGGRHIDALVLGRLERSSAALQLLRDLRGGTLPVWSCETMPVVTLAPLVRDDELDALRAYKADSDHHVGAGVGYLYLRAVLQAIERRTRRDDRRVLRVGPVEIDTAAREARVTGELVELSAIEFGLLCTLASDPQRVFTKGELLRDVWGFETTGRTRTVGSHACRLRRKLAEHGANAIVNVWGDRR